MIVFPNALEKNIAAMPRSYHDEGMAAMLLGMVAMNHDMIMVRLPCFFFKSYHDHHVFHALRKNVFLSTIFSQIIYALCPLYGTLDCPLRKLRLKTAESASLKIE